MTSKCGRRGHIPLHAVVFFFLVILVSGCTSQAPVTVLISPQAVAVGTGQTVQFTPIATNGAAVSWSASAGTIDANGLYTAPPGSQSMTVMVTAKALKDSTKSATASVDVVAPGQVTATVNPQVASYTIAPAGAGNVSVQFGTDTNYGFTTWTQPVPTGGGAVSLFVAGMRGNTLYHIRGVVQFADGTQFLDTDQTFNAGAFEPAEIPKLTVTTTPGMRPQSGVELLDLIYGTTGQLSAVVTDLSGNVIWGYNPGSSVPAGWVLGPIKLMPNGHFLANWGLANSMGESSTSILQEVDLTGKVIWQLTAAQLNQALESAQCAGCNVTILATHHDVAILPNGHLIVIADTQQVISGTTVTGDVIIDLDQNHNPVWLWNEFDHLDTNRRPYLWPDWTHTNAVLYSADDGNLIVSIRHQNWLVKVDYANGSGAGDIIWHLGYQGDFTLVGGTDPTNWFYAQHGPSFVSSNTTGKFSLALFDNGDDRVFPPGVTCGSSGAPPCLYSTVPIFDLDESAMTATFSFHVTAPTYSFFGGNASVLQNGNVEFCESAEPTGLAGDIYEVSQDENAQTVWHMQITGQYAYRGQRVPSLYPGVQW